MFGLKSRSREKLINILKNYRVELQVKPYRGQTMPKGQNYGYKESKNLQQNSRYVKAKRRESETNHKFNQ